MGKSPLKIYWSSNRKARMDVFKNKIKNGSEYNIFKLFLYIYKKPQPLCLKKNEVYELQELLSQIKIKGYDYPWLK